MDRQAFQDRIEDNFCFGCGPTNERGLRIKSYWDGPGEAVCTFVPGPHHAAGPKQYLNGGIIATIIDCHAICTAIANVYRSEGREIGEGESVWCATASLEVAYLAPTPIDRPVHLRARIVEGGERKTVVACSLRADGAPTAEGRVVAVRVPRSWREGSGAHGGPRETA